MPRNEFAPYLCDECTRGLHHLCSEPGVCQCEAPVDNNHPGKGEDEDPNQEVLPVTEEDPHLWPRTFLRPSLAELRRERGAATTAAHIAEMKSRDPSLFD